MSAGRPMIQNSGVNAQVLNPGDTLILGESVAAGVITTVGDGVLTGPKLVTGLITRSGPVADATDTTDTAWNILLALAGNSNGADVLPGSTFRFRYINLTALEITIAAGVGVTLDATNGTNVFISDDATSPVRDFIFTVLNAQAPVTAQCLTTNGNKIITFVLPVGRTSRAEVGSNGGDNITPGMVVSGTGITGGTKVVGLTLGQGGLTGVVTDTNSTATSAAGGVALTFGPSLLLTSLGGSVL